MGTIPTIRKWRAVVAQIVGGDGPLHDDVGRIAAQTLDAAAPALEQGKDDPGLRYSFYLLTQIVSAARQDDWRQNLAQVGIRLEADSSIFDLTSEVQRATDDYLARRGVHSDISEMAQQAAGEAVASLAAPSAATLFGRGGDELQRAVRELSTKSGFSRLGQVFFGRFMARFLNFYLSRVTARELGTDRLPNIEGVSRFNKALLAHCEQSARMVRDFCGQWYSKTEYMKGIDLQNTSRFMAVALRKLSRELAKQRADA